MNAIHSETEPQSEILPELAPSPPLLRTLVACDLVESTAMTEQLGDRGAADFVHQLDRHSRDLLQRHNGQEIDKTDGFLLLFERPIQAVAFALDYQRLLHKLGEVEFLPLRARIGIHVGDVVLWRNTASDVARGAKPVEIEGLVKPVAARLMTLARPGQILLSDITHTLALRAQDELKADTVLPQWRAHGHYRFKGVAEPIAVFEIGEPGVAPLHAPAYSSKAHREVPWWRRPGIMAIEAVALVAAIAIPAYFFLRSPPAIGFAARDWIVVGDLRNLTAETSFNDSLQTAFRMGLEQSHYVNVLSDLKVRDTVKQMQRDPDKTPVDRAVGAEVAIRDGARALILPTVAEIGGHVRVTAEVIDPQTQATVYSESADGSGIDSVLPSIDHINTQLRARLGEALATVSSQSQPLEKVATKSLDALRAYSLAYREYNAGQFVESASLFRQALKLDGNFALAHVGLARALLSVDQDGAAREEIQLAYALRDHLPPREALYVDAWQANFGPPVAALNKWKALAALYPDFYAAQGTYAFFAWQKANRFDDAIQAAKEAASPFNPYRKTSDYLLGALYLGNEKFAEAEDSFVRAEDPRVLGNREFFALCYAAQHQFDKADTILAKAHPFGDKGADIYTHITSVALKADKGRWDEMLSEVTQAKEAAKTIGPWKVSQFHAMELSLLTLSDSRTTQLRALGDYLHAERAVFDQKKDVDRIDVAFHILLVGYLAAHLDDSELTDAVLSIDLGEAAGEGYPLLTHILVATRAERSRLNGHPEDAIKILKPTFDGSELYVSHATLMEAYSAAGQTESALEQAGWLASHRGRAYAEYNAERILAPFNVTQSNLALLRSAELELTLQKKDEARRKLSAFLEAWPNAATISFVASRVQKLQAAL
jgi:putative peptide modification system cyclase